MQETQTSELKNVRDERRGFPLLLMPLDDGVLAFSEQAQLLFAVNATGASVLQQLQHGLRAEEIVQSLVEQGLAAPEVAESWVSSMVDVLAAGENAGQDQIAGPRPAVSDSDYPEAANMPSLKPFTVKAERFYRLLGTTVLIRFALNDQARMVDSVIGHLAAEGTQRPDSVIDIPGVNTGQIQSYIYRDGKPIAYARRLSQVAPIVKGQLWQCAVNAYDFLFYIHAGVVGAGQNCILLPAAPGSGKSSLTAALTHRGFTYFSDEVALIESHSFRVPPAPLAVCVKGTGWEMMAAYYPEVLRVPTHGRSDGKMVRYVPPRPETVAKASAPVSHIVFPKYSAKSTTELRAISRSDALGRIMDECLALRRRLTAQDAQDVCRWIQGIDCYTLRFSSLAEAADLVSKLAAAAPATSGGR